MNRAGATPVVTVYWRPGCGFCSILLAQMERSEIDFTTVNIWEDPAAAAYVRSVARGHETVPTVQIADRAMVNPSFAEVSAAVASSSIR